MQQTLFQKIRNSCEAVVEQAKWVTIDTGELFKYPELLLGNTKNVNIEHTREHHFLDKGDDTLAYFLILDAINFGSGYFPFLKKNQAMSGYFTVAKRLKAYVEETGIPDPKLLFQLDASSCSQIFKQPIDDKHTAELMQLFATALSQLGKWTIDEYDGDYLGFLRSSSSAEAAISALLKMPMYRDVADYFGTEVIFLKRAQITIQDMLLADPNNPLLNFPDANDLTVFADNVLPYVFRLEGLTSYDPWLEKRIANEELIASGSSEEIELRAAAVYLGEKLGDIIKEEYGYVSVRELDYRLWLRGQALKTKSDLKRHRCRCVYY